MNFGFIHCKKAKVNAAKNHGKNIQSELAASSSRIIHSANEVGPFICGSCRASRQRMQGLKCFIRENVP